MRYHRALRFGQIPVLGSQNAALNFASRSLANTATTRKLVRRDTQFAAQERYALLNACSPSIETIGEYRLSQSLVQLDAVHGLQHFASAVG